MNFPKRGISIDIGNEKVKIVEYIKKRDKISVINGVLFDTPNNVLKDGQLFDMETIIGYAKEALEGVTFKSKNAIFTISSSKIITREVDLPDLPKKKLDTLIKLNAEEYFPVDLKDYTLDYAIVEHFENNGDKQVRVNIIAAPTQILEGYIELATSLGLNVTGIDYSGNSIVNFAKLIEEDKPYMLLDLGSETTMVTIMNQGIVRFNRSLIYGTKVVTNSIQNHFGVDFKEAVRISAEQALLNVKPEGNDFLGSDVTSALNQVLSGVARLVDFYNSRNKEAIESIVLVGGGTNIVGIADYIENYFNISTRIIAVEDIKITASDTFMEDMVFYANALGATYSTLNLIPESILEKDKGRAETRLKIELAFLAVAVSAALIYFPYATVKGLERERDALVAEKAEKEAIIPIKEAYSNALVEYNYYSEVTELSSSIERLMVSILETMEEEIPSGISYISLSNSEDAMIISCVAEEKLDLVQLIIALKAMEVDEQKIFSDVFVPAFSYSESDDDEDRNIEYSSDTEPYYSFAITCYYKTEEVQ